MKWSLIKLVFIKDGRELLRDRRTLFVNVILPLLLYPILAMFFLQLSHFAVAGPDDWPRIALIDGEEELFAALPLASQEPLPADPLQHYLLEDEEAQIFRQVAEELAAGDADQTVRNHPIMSELRSRRLALVIVRRQGADERPHYSILADDAHPRFDAAWEQVREGLHSLRQQRLKEAVQRAGLDPDQTLDPQPTQRYLLAGKQESIRVRLASIVPIILVMLALSGAFMPAIDLIAGERERGTLETLLSLPGGRAEIFAGKLLLVGTASLLNVLLNLLSLGLTAHILGSALADPSIGGGEGLGLILDLPSLLIAVIVLLPLCLSLAAVSLGLAGLAASTKEAQNYLGPLFIVVMVPTFAAMLPNIGPSPALNMLPILGPVLVLKEALQSPGIPWAALLMTSLASLAVAWVVIAWSARLLEDEGFLFPGLNRAGWGRFRRWGQPPTCPGALEALGLFAACLGSFLVVSMLMAGQHPLLVTLAGQFLGLLAPVFIHGWLGAYRPREAWFWRPPDAAGWAMTAALIPLVWTMSFAWGQVQTSMMPPQAMEEMQAMQQFIQAILDLGGLPLLLFALAIVPALCEEMLCRGSLLSGLRRGLGPWGAVLVSSLLFGLMHMSPWRFVGQSAMGIVVAVLVLRSKSIWTAIIVHAAHNGGLILFAFAIDALLDSDQAGEELWVNEGGIAVWLLLFILAGLACALILWKGRAASSPPSLPFASDP